MGDHQIDDKLEQAKGAVKQTVGDLTDNERLEAEGRADRTAGKVKETAGKVVEGAKDVAGNVADKVEDAVDNVADRIKK